MGCRGWAITPQSGHTNCLGDARGSDAKWKTSAEFLAELDHPNVGLNYAHGNIYYYNDDIDRRRTWGNCGPRHCIVHLKTPRGKRRVALFVRSAKAG